MGIFPGRGENKKHLKPPPSLPYTIHGYGVGLYLLVHQDISKRSIDPYTWHWPPIGFNVAPWKCRAPQPAVRLVRRSLFTTGLLEEQARSLRKNSPRFFTAMAGRKHRKLPWVFAWKTLNFPDFGPDFNPSIRRVTTSSTQRCFVVNIPVPWSVWGTISSTAGTSHDAMENDNKLL